jgi:L-rhamnose mutarotase
MKIRKAFVMSVHAGAEQEYENRHNPIWPELEKVLKDHGVSNYLILLHLETRQLFGYAEIESEEQRVSIPSTDACQRWWKHLSDIMAYLEAVRAVCSTGIIIVRGRGLVAGRLLGRGLDEFAFAHRAAAVFVEAREGLGGLLRFAFSGLGRHELFFGQGAVGVLVEAVELRGALFGHVGLRRPRFTRVKGSGSEERGG